jgi:hypothetical protein
MLKLTYTENSFYLECPTQFLEAWVMMMLSVYLSQL